MDAGKFVEPDVFGSGNGFGGDLGVLEAMVEASGTAVGVSLVDGQVREGVDGGHVLEAFSNGHDSGFFPLLYAPIIRFFWVRSIHGSNYLYRFFCFPSLESIIICGYDVICLDGMQFGVEREFSPLLLSGLDISHRDEDTIFVRLLRVLGVDLEGS